MDLELRAFEIQDNVDGSPSVGDQHIELDATGPSSISQMVATTSGAMCTLSYDFSPRPGIADNQLQVLVNGVQLALHAASGVGLPDTVWSPFSINFTAVGASTTVGFANLDVSDFLGTYLDNVALVCMPVVPAMGRGVTALLLGLLLLVGTALLLRL